MPSTEIITIGTEILLGEIVDTNAHSIARRLCDLGIDIYRKTTVGDNSQRIATAIQYALTGCDIVLTTGGLGPTVDDPTREAVALAFGVELEFRPDLWKQIQARFARFGRLPTENNRRQAYIPHGAKPIENPVGTAPAFIFESGHQLVISLPGVPSEMEYLLEHEVIPYLRQYYQLHGTIKTRLLHTAGVGESLVDERIGDLETLTNPTVGLAAHTGQVDVRITAKAGSDSEADHMLDVVETEIRERLGNWIYGVDGETLEQVSLNHLAELGWSLRAVVDSQVSELIQRLAHTASPFLGAEVLASPPDPDSLRNLTAAERNTHSASVGLGVAIYPQEMRQEIKIVLITPTGEELFSHPYGGPPQYAPRWATNHALNILRNLSSQETSQTEMKGKIK